MNALRSLQTSLAEDLQDALNVFGISLNPIPGVRHTRGPLRAGPAR